MSLQADREVLDTVLEDLDTRARSQHPGESAEDYWVCQRRHPRYAFRTDCVVRFFSTTGKMTTLQGRTRNLSRGGIGLLVRNVFRKGEAIEVELQLPKQPRMYMAGVVQFIRYAGRGYHELGVALKTAGAQPVFSDNPAQAMRSLDWLKDATRVA